MQTKYPSTWKRDYSDSPYTNNGQLTVIASEWSIQLTGLTPQQIRTGVENLSNRENKAFAPNAMEFRDLCAGSDYENALDSIICRLQTGDDYKWNNQRAFNIFIFCSSELKTAKMLDVPKIVKRVNNMIDVDSMRPLPDYSIKQIEKPEPKEIAPKHQRQLFQSHMYSSIYRHNPELFEQTEEQKKQKFINSDESAILPPVMQKIFSAQGTTELINKFKSSGYVMPEKRMKLELVKSYRKTKDKSIEIMTRFLTDQKIIIK